MTLVEQRSAKKLTKLVYTLFGGDLTYECCKVRADYLIDNGVVALPCMIGDTVWFCDWELMKVFDLQVRSITYTQQKNECSITIGGGIVTAPLQEKIVSGIYEKSVFVDKGSADLAMSNLERRKRLKAMGIKTQIDDELPLPTRVINILKRNNVCTIEDILELDARNFDFTELCNIGKTTAQEITKAIEVYKKNTII